MLTLPREQISKPGNGWARKVTARFVHANQDSFERITMIINDTAKCVNIIRSINYIDSSLFGLGIDIFKVRIMVSATLSSELKSFGFNERFEGICCDFSQIRNLELEIKKSTFGPLI